MTADEIKQVERLVNDHVRLNHDVETDIMDIESAKSKVMALFGEKYDDQVRVLSWAIFPPSCGGIHGFQYR